MRKIADACYGTHVRDTRALQDQKEARGAEGAVGRIEELEED